MNSTKIRIILNFQVLIIILSLILSSFGVSANVIDYDMKIVSKGIFHDKDIFIQQNNYRREDAIYFYNASHTEGSAIGLEGGGTFEGAIRITPEELTNKSYWKLIAANFYHYVNPGTSTSHSGTVKIYDQGTSTQPGNILETKDFTVTGDGWHRIDLSTPVPLNISRDIWVSIEVNHDPEEFPLSTDEGPAVDGKGDWVSQDGGGTWDELQELGTPPLDFNWQIEGIVYYEELGAHADVPQRAHVNSTIHMNGSATGGTPPYTWLWDFGDGENSTLQDTTHVYNETGFYNISLKVTDNKTDIAYDNVTIQIVPEGADITPPETNCTLDGVTEEGVYIKNVTVTLTAFDNESGVNFTKYKLNDGTYTAYAEPFILTEEGNHTLYFYSVDNASNVEEEKSCTFSIEPSKTELGINISKTEVIIKNIGDENATDVVWSVDIKGGIFGLTDEHIDGNISNLAVEEVVDLPSFFCFGRVEIVAAADATNAKEVTEVANGFMIFFFILGIRNF